MSAVSDERELSAGFLAGYHGEPVGNHSLRWRQGHELGRIHRDRVAAQRTQDWQTLIAGGLAPRDTPLDQWAEQ